MGDRAGADLQVRDPRVVAEDAGRPECRDGYGRGREQAEREGVHTHEPATLEDDCGDDERRRHDHVLHPREARESREGDERELRAA